MWDMDINLYYFIIIFIISFLPIAEVRGSIPLAFLWFRNNPNIFPLAIAIAIIGNLIIAPLVLPLLSLFEKKLINRYIHTKIGDLYLRIINRARRKSREVEKYGFLGLAIFVAIPIPGTGAWTASLIAHIIGMEKKKALASIELGVIGASLIVFSVIYLGIEILKKVFMLG